MIMWNMHPDIKFGRNGDWTLKNNEASYDASSYIPSLLNEEKSISLYELLSEAEMHTQFTEAFTHQTNKNSANEIDTRLLFATIISLGSNLGHTNMSKAAPEITSKQLLDTEKLWLSNQNLNNANNKIVELIQSLPLPSVYSKLDGRLHTSSDGQKVVVAVNSLLANYSYKYYGKEQGITVNSFVDNKQSFFHVNVLSSSDREAAFMMDGIVSSKESIYKESDLEHIHSTDTHGYTEAMFSGLHFLDVAFAPHIKGIHNQTLYGYESKSLKKNSNFTIAPKQTVNKKLILTHWDEILHLMASIKLGYCSASLIFRALSSSKTSKLYQAIREFGRLLKSTFILNYLRDTDLRKSVRKQLNRVELGQRMSKAIFFGRKGVLKVGLGNEIQKAVSCTILLKNAIILWNYLYLSSFLYETEDKEEKQAMVDSISRGSVIAWAHVNMYGIYLFNKRQKTRSFKATLKQMQSQTF